MTDLQKVEFDILKTVVEICDQLNLRYYLVCGSALGAVKYGGFIPWDDDIDIGLPREDYEVFIQEAQELLPGYYFLQNYRTDKKFPLFMSKVRDSRTTFIENVYKDIDMHHGVYIDIFPLDGYPKDQKEIVALEKQKALSSRLRSVRYHYETKNILSIGVRTTIYRVMYKVFGMYSDTARAVEKFDNVAKSFKIEDSDYICNHSNWQGTIEYAPKWHYGEGAWTTFEGLRVKVPENFDAYLTQKYGNWRADLPVSKRNSGHCIYKLDLNTSYSEYTKK